MKLMVLGGGTHQLNLIKKAKNLGHQLIICDYLPNPPGRMYADYYEQVSTFDFRGCLRAAEKNAIDGVATAGTDQPVYTVARVAEKLNLPRFLDSNTAAAVTNKKKMKSIFREHDIPTPNFAFLTAEDYERVFSLRFPLVFKPLDSQGQRGVIRVNSAAEVVESVAYTFSFTEKNEILAEEYYPGREITYSGWCDFGEPEHLLLTDRLTFEEYPHLGICTSHLFPSRFMQTHREEIYHLVRKIIKAFSLKEGPLYFQFLIGEDGIKVNEIACRIGGAFEDVLLEKLTGVNILDRIVHSALSIERGAGKYISSPPEEIFGAASAQFVFACPGKVSRLGDLKELRTMPGFCEAEYYLRAGDYIPPTQNAGGRAGHFILTAKDKIELEQRLRKAYEFFRIEDMHGNNLVRKFSLGMES